MREKFPLITFSSFSSFWFSSLLCLSLFFLSLLSSTKSFKNQHILQINPSKGVVHIPKPTITKSNPLRQRRYQIHRLLFIWEEKKKKKSNPPMDYQPMTERQRRKKG